MKLNDEESKKQIVPLIFFFRCLLFVISFGLQYVFISECGQFNLCNYLYKMSEKIIWTIFVKTSLESFPKPNELFLVSLPIERVIEFWEGSCDLTK